MNSWPPLAPLRAVVGRLESAGLVCALGGSGLLASLGLADSARDWDLTTDQPLARVREALRELDHDLVGPNRAHADTKLQLAGGQIELIVGFAIRSGDAVIRLPTIVTGRWIGVPTGSPEVWAAAYQIMGRPEKAALLFGLLEKRGVDGAAVARLLAEPLPQELREQLGRLPKRATSSNT